jgi:dTDP-4-dehydrorhamnose reductase
MKILLTGCTGQVGHALQQQLRQHPQHELISLTRQQMDLTQADSIRHCIREHQPDLLINPAAYTAVDLAEDEVALAHQINAHAPAIMAEEMKAINGGLIHFSTDYVFDGSKASAYTETDQTAPLGVYGHSKLAGEQAIQAINGKNGKHLIFRTSWVYSDFGKNFLLTMLRLAEQRDELKIVADQFGAPTHAGFLAKVVTEIVNKHDLNWQNLSGLYHLTPTGSTSWFGFAQAIMAGAQQRGILKKIPQLDGITTAEYPLKAPRPHNSRLSTALFQERFAIPMEDWQTSLDDCLDQMRQSTTQNMQEPRKHLG